jgi:predicted RNA binding protein YcfA (HicA-like mRNA interferase family)
MPPFGPISRRDLIRALRSAGFDGPYSGGKHSFMLKGDLALTLPNPHQGEIGRDLLARILRQAGISRDAWERLGIE